MKKLLGVDVTATLAFNKTAGTLTITNYATTLTKANMLLIINATRNQIMMNFIDPSLTYTLVNNVITFGYSTASMDNTDVLQVYVDVEGFDDSFNAFMRRLISLMESNGVVDSSGRQRVIIDTIATAAVTNTTGLGPNVTGNTPGSATPNTVSAIPMLTVSEGPVDQRWRIMDSAQTAYGACTRAQLTW